MTHDNKTVISDKDPVSQLSSASGWLAGLGVSGLWGFLVPGLGVLAAELKG